MVREGVLQPINIKMRQEPGHTHIAIIGEVLHYSETILQLCELFQGKIFGYIVLNDLLANMSSVWQFLENL